MDMIRGYALAYTGSVSTISLHTENLEVLCQKLLLYRERQCQCNINNIYINTQELKVVVN